MRFTFRQAADSDRFRVLYDKAVLVWREGTDISLYDKCTTGKAGRFVRYLSVVVQIL